MKPKPIHALRHPTYQSEFLDYDKWRLTYEGGELFRNRYLKQFSTREDKIDFNLRREVTPVPRYAGAAIDQIRNSIFQRLRDVSRYGGSDAYRRAVAGEDGGIDRNGSTMNSFLGTKILTDLLVIGKAGVFVDNSSFAGATLADSRESRPYAYAYAAEDILNWRCSDPEKPGEFQAVLLRDRCMSYDHATGLPVGIQERYRKVWIQDGVVLMEFFDADGNQVNRDGIPSMEVIELELQRIPFTLIDLGRSLMKDVADYQIALLNLTSSDVAYALRANTTFYVEQADLRAVGNHLKNVATDEAGDPQESQQENIKVGATQGRQYAMGMDRPSFIHPSSEPLQASLELQSNLKEDIYRTVNLAVATLSSNSRQSAESKSLDNQGLEAGLSYIGLCLENAERQIADYFAAYEHRNPNKRQIATIKYPDRYSLKTDSDRIDEAERLSELLFKIPSREAKREIYKNVVESLLSGRATVEKINQIEREIDESAYLTSDPKTILEAVKTGLAGEKTGSVALGFNDDEYLTAREDHANRLKRIQEAQTPKEAPAGDRPAARGIPDADPNPDSGKEERAEANDPDKQGDRTPPTRGEGK